ncbi:DUF3131 domain-containing protein [Caldimonas tepidiphila]|uniref:DUF3131 domain-containing protein n=1 Tax=Caldimonas tepidiphila TaxID=2315841 RepID=UPI00196AE138|nr:DUF3131 domain-containing protein [Caldimonas tepidiphila]
MKTLKEPLAGLGGRLRRLPGLLALAATMALAGCGIVAQQASDARHHQVAAEVSSPRRGALTEREMEMARIAWTYFENNFQPKTGFVNAVQNYPSTTMWDTASYMAALLAARELGLIDKDKYDTRLRLLLGTLLKLDLFRGEMPNKVYDTQTAAKVDYTNKPGEIGFSAIDLGRLFIWLKITKERFPEHSDAIDRFMLRLDFRRVLDRNGTMFGAMLDKEGKVQYVQEGRLGYEEYAAKGFELWGFNAAQALAPEPFDTIQVYGVALPYDTRDPRRFSQHNYVVAESYVLDALEMNWDQALDRRDDDRHHSQCWMADFGHRVYRVQEMRHQVTGILTARTEHQLDRAPYFVYDTIYSDGYPWNTITDTGKYVPEVAAVALKAALGMWVLWETPYTDLLFDAISSAHDPKKGFFEGLYENGSGPIREHTANNNGIMLEALLYKVQGKLLKWGERDGGLWEAIGADPFAENVKGVPRFVRASLVKTPTPSVRPNDPGRLWRASQAGPAAPSCGRCSCANEPFDYSPGWRVQPR